MKSSYISADRNRPQRNCIVKLRNLKQKKAKENTDRYLHLFYDNVAFYCLFIFKLYASSKKDKTNLSFKRKYKEIMSELYLICARWKNLIELKSLCFYPVSKHHLKTSVVCFNYKKPGARLGGVKK